MGTTEASQQDLVRLRVPAAGFGLAMLQLDKAVPPEEVDGMDLT